MFCSPTPPKITPFFPLHHFLTTRSGQQFDILLHDVRPFANSHHNEAPTSHPQDGTNGLPW
jgi:hypothetical protein